MTETFLAWQCIGCGRLEGTAQCVGICQDRKVELVDANDYRKVAAAAEHAAGRADALEDVVRMIAFTTPHEGEWASAWLALQARAKRAMQRAPTAVEASNTARQGENA
ncbi:MAG: hypothetical protein IPH30_17075 [Betaproteobacteria bacterium]|nr:hypothetical protein [Betaproteobacteria bacterium]